MARQTFSLSVFCLLCIFHKNSLLLSQIKNALQQVFPASKNLFIQMCAQITFCFMVHLSKLSIRMNLNHYFTRKTRSLQMLYKRNFEVNKKNIALKTEMNSLFSSPHEIKNETTMKTFFLTFLNILNRTSYNGFIFTHSRCSRSRSTRN